MILSKYNQILSSLQSQFLTNMSSDDIYHLASDQVTDRRPWSLVTYRLSGSTYYAQTASMPGRNLSITDLYDNQVEFIRVELSKLINGETISQETLP